MTTETITQLVLDFDGVIVESLEECVAVSWWAFECQPIQEIATTQALAPKAMESRFQALRPFMCHLGHFLVPFRYPLTPIATQEAFEEISLRIPMAEVDSFKERVQQARTILRHEYPDVWQSMHQFYPGLLPFIQYPPAPVALVSAREQESIQMLLEGTGVSIEASWVYGGISTSKVEALDEIARRTGYAPAQILFLDDHLPHVREARKAGYYGMWAKWGYHTPFDEEQARLFGIPTLELDHLPLLLAQHPWSSSGKEKRA